MNAASTAVVMSSVTISVFFKHDLTSETITLKFGEYGGKQCSYTSLMRYLTLVT